MVSLPPVGKPSVEGAIANVQAWPARLRHAPALNVKAGQRPFGVFRVGSRRGRCRRYGRIKSRNFIRRPPACSTEDTHYDILVITTTPQPLLLNCILFAPCNFSKLILRLGAQVRLEICHPAEKIAGQRPCCAAVWGGERLGSKYGYDSRK